VPQIEFEDALDDSCSWATKELIRKRGVAVVKNVFGREEALSFKQQVRDYIADNKDKTKAFPKHNPQVYELYWSPSQIKARADPRMLHAQNFLQKLWRSSKSQDTADLTTPMTYADRLRIRTPGDASFALGYVEPKL